MPGRVICDIKLAYNPPGLINLIILGTGLNGLFFSHYSKVFKVQTLHYCEHCIVLLFKEFTLLVCCIFVLS